MSTLTIRKKSLKTWLHTDSILGDFIISKFYFNADNLSFQIVEQGKSKRVIYNIADITLYALPTGGTAETFANITDLSLRLEALNYPAFQYDGQITSIANLIDAGTNVTITGDGTEASPYVISSTGGGGSQNIDQVLAVGDSATDKQINFFNGTNEVFISGDGLSFQDNVASENLGMDAHKISKLNGSNVVELEFVAPTGTAGKIRFPDVVNATKIVAMTDQIPTIDATPTDGSNNAVSSNGVFDALATKQNSLGFTPYKFLQTSQTAHTGTTAETIIATATITGNIFNSNDVMKMLYRFSKPSGTAGGTFQIRINTSNTLSGSVVIFAGTFNNTTRQGLIERTFDLQGGNLYGFNFASAVATDVISGTTALSSTAYNTANILYVFFTLALSNSADSVIPNLCNITN